VVAVHSVALGLEVLLAGLHPALWDRNLEPETLRFLSKRGKDLSERDLSVLLAAILKGPPRGGHRKDLADEIWSGIRDHAIRLRLHMLIESGARLPGTAQQVYDRIQESDPWQPTDDQSEEPGGFSPARQVGQEGTNGIEDFETMSVEKFIQWSQSQTCDPWRCGGGWQDFFENCPMLAIDLLVAAAQRGHWSIPPWYTALTRLGRDTDIPNALESKIASTLIDMPAEKMKKLDLQAARWLEYVRPKLGKLLGRAIWRRIWECASKNEVCDSRLDFDMTANHSGGILGSILYDETAEYIPTVPAVGQSPGLPRQLGPDFRRISESESLSARLARMRMAPMLFILYRIDPQWTERAFLSRMNPDSTRFDPLLWEGYFWSPRFTDDLVMAFKESFLKVPGNLDDKADHVRVNGAQLFIHIAIPPERRIDMAEARGVLYKMSPAQLAYAVEALKRMLEAAGGKSSALWRETIGPWFKGVWPRRTRDRSPELSGELARMAMEAGDAFPEAVTAIEGILTEEQWDWALLDLHEREKDSRLVSRFPKAALTLMDRIVSSQSRVEGVILGALLDKIEASDPELRHTAGFKRLALIAR
jgi:hypothetical protein